MATSLTRYELWNLVIGSAGVAVVFFYALVTWWQLRELRRANGLTAQGLALEQRAQLNVTMSSWPLADSPLIGVIWIQNVGRLPATMINYGATHFFWHVGTAEPVFPDVPLGPIEGLGSQQSMWRDVHIEVTPEERALLAAQGAHLCVACRIEYSDQLANNTRNLRFGWYLSGPGLDTWRFVPGFHSVEV